MKTPLLLVGLFLLTFHLHAQTTRYVALMTTNGNVSYPVSTSDTVTVVTTGPNGGNMLVYTPLGSWGGLTKGSPYSGFTNVTLLSGAGIQYVTLQIVSCAPVSIASNYVPADAVVIPASSIGPVQVILETSPDLVNWTAASPGTYSPANGTNRFFRVRAVAN